jgi:F420H(2)-dependent quinone reductase
VAPLRDGHDWLIAASAGGSPTNPAWYYNLLAHPDITIETPEGSEQVSAQELLGDEYTAARRLSDADATTFADHQEHAGATASMSCPSLRGALRYPCRGCAARSWCGPAYSSAGCRGVRHCEGRAARTGRLLRIRTTSGPAPHASGGGVARSASRRRNASVSL